MNSSRRHDSLIPLSHDHHHALVLCLRIHRGLQEQGDEEGWLAAMAERAVQFFESDLRPHFKLEEEILFPAMQRLPQASGLITDLLGEHRAMEGFIGLFRQPQEAALPERLEQFADLLKSHIRKEENELFPLCEKLLDPQLIDKIGQEMQAQRG